MAKGAKHKRVGPHVKYGVSLAHYRAAKRYQKIHGGGFMDILKKIGQTVGTIGNVGSKITGVLGQILPGSLGQAASTASNVLGTVGNVGNAIGGSGLRGRRRKGGAMVKNNTRFLAQHRKGGG